MFRGTGMRQHGNSYYNGDGISSARSGSSAAKLAKGEGGPHTSRSWTQLDTSATLPQLLYGCDRLWLTDLREDVRRRVSSSMGLSIHSSSWFADMVHVLSPSEAPHGF